MASSLFYSLVLVENAKLNGVDPKQYLKQALRAALERERSPLPHELT
ncbi:MAG: hypothetical protein ACT4TC_23365 [Myxococcaceae bacterium]